MPIPSTGSTAPPRGQKRDEPLSEGSGPLVSLHIYDVGSEDVVQQVNDVFRPLSTGMFHAGVEVLGKEYSFGYTDKGSGITTCLPRGNHEHKYRETVYKGRTSLTPEKVQSLLVRMHQEWPGWQYDILTRNCCHFSDAFCRALGVGPAPEWVTNMAGAGAMLRSGVKQAVAHAQAGARIAAQHASELDERYQIASRVDEFSTRQVNVDEEYLKNRAQQLWSSATTQLGNAGAMFEKFISDAQKPISLDTSRVDTAVASLWSWASGDSPPPVEQEDTLGQPGNRQTGSCCCRPSQRFGTSLEEVQAYPTGDKLQLPLGDNLPVNIKDELKARPEKEGRRSSSSVLGPVPPARPSRGPPKFDAAPELVTEASSEESTPAATTSATSKSAAAAAVGNGVEEAARQAGFAASALDFEDWRTASRCLRQALSALELAGVPPPEEGKGIGEDISYKTREAIRRLAERAVETLGNGGQAAAAANLLEALDLLEGRQLLDGEVKTL